MRRRLVTHMGEGQQRQIQAQRGKQQQQDGELRLVDERQVDVDHHEEPVPSCNDIQYSPWEMGTPLQREDYPYWP